MRKIDKQIEECRNHMKPYMKNEESTNELREMCKCCEVYCGKEHDYDECRNKPCFRFWLAYEYLGWMNAFS
jgi:hypothetical protein